MAEEKQVKKKSFKEETLVTINDKVKLLQSHNAIDLPDDYSAGNALQAAFFNLKEVKTSSSTGFLPALEACTQKSISEALFQMVTEGMNPSKKQCYFIVYQDKKTNEFQLTYMRSYHGTVLLAKRNSGVKSVIAREVYKDDEYETDIDISGRKYLVHHKQTMQSMDGEIIGGYAIVTDCNGDEHLTEMSIKKIKTSWGQGVTKGNGDVHKKFTDEMVKRTLINRACKPYINSSNDEAIIDDDNKQKPSLEIPALPDRKSNGQLLPAQETEEIPEAEEVSETKPTKPPFGS